MCVLHWAIGSRKDIQLHTRNCVTFGVCPVNSLSEQLEELSL